METEGVAVLRRFSQPALLIVAVALLVTNVLLQRHNRELSSAIANLEASEGPPVGSSVKVISGTDLSNAPFSLDYSNRTDRSLLLVLSPACGYCKENWKYWLRILKESPNVRVVLADTTGEVTPDYFRENGIGAPEQVIKLSGPSRLEHNLRVTPTTVVIGPSGRIDGVWVGVLNSRKVEAVNRLLEVRDSAVLTKEERE